MVDKRLIEKFIQGLASEEEAALCESYLKECDPSTIDSVLVSQMDQETVDDTLLASLRASSEPLDPCTSATEHINASIQRRLESGDISRFLRPAEADDEIGRLGPYRILERTGSGGMGIVFRAQRIADSDEAGQDDLEFVALKLMNPMMASNPQTAERFQREVRSAARLEHPRIVRILDVGTDNGLPFFTMNFLQGQSLRQRLDDEGKLSADTSVRIALQIAEGLEFANAHGILHRDIKPDNLWLNESGNIIILDFGLARGLDDTAGLTNTGDVLGTPRYMAPEQVKGQTTDHRTDLFGLGCVLYEMITGRSKFDEANVYSTMMAVTQGRVAIEELTETGCPEALADLTCRLLEKTPEQRPDSATSVIRELRQMECSDAATLQASDEKPPVRWRPFLIGGIAASLLFALAFVIYWQTDQGTLVIEAGNGVEIRTNSPTVTVRLIESDRAFHVQAGENRLPTGVYEVVINEKERITLSSNRFVIRRGEPKVVSFSPQGHGPGPEANRVVQQFSGIGEWFDESRFQSMPTDQIRVSLGEVVLALNRQVVVRMTAALNFRNGEQRVDPTLFHHSLDRYFGRKVDIIRDGKSLGTATIVNALPEKNGESNPGLPLVARLDAETIRNRVIVQPDDVIALVHTFESPERRMITSLSPKLSNSSTTPSRIIDVRSFLKEQFPDHHRIYAGYISHVSEITTRIVIDRYFDMTIQRPRMGEEHLSNHEWEVPGMAGQQVHFFLGKEEVAEGYIENILGLHDRLVAGIAAVNDLEVKNEAGEKIAAWKSLRRGSQIFIPVSDDRLVPLRK